MVMVSLIPKAILQMSAKGNVDVDQQIQGNTAAGCGADLFFVAWQEDLLQPQ